MSDSKRFRTAAEVETFARRTIDRAVVTDMHTHLFPPSHGELFSSGIDELLTYHYLAAELFSVAPAGLTPAKFYTLARPRQAELVWQHVFLHHGPISEAAHGVLTCLRELGIEPGSRDLTRIRSHFAGLRPGRHMQRVMDLARIDYAVMTNDPFVPTEARQWLAAREADGRLKPALRIDKLIADLPGALGAMREQGSRATSAGGLAASRKFLAQWAGRIKPLYLAASLRGTFQYPGRDAGAKVFDHVALPLARELGLPIAIMIGVRRGVNPNLRDAGDGMESSNLQAVEALCAANPDVKFLATVLSLADQHALCVLGRKFPNLHVFGCWWFCNTPSSIAAITQMRLDLLGTAVTLQHSDSRVLEQLLYKWSHSRQAIGEVFARQYRGLFESGWRPSAEEIKRDARAVLGGSFEKFIGR